MALHEIPLERSTLHGHFSRDLQPILTVDSGDSVTFACLNSGWRNAEHELFPERREGELDAGHALIGPIAVHGARAGGTLAIRIDALRMGAGGVTQAGGFSTPLNDRLGLAEGETMTLLWSLDADQGVGRSDSGREVALAPFLGVIGMPPDEPGIHSTAPPRPSGGNIDCKELVPGTTLFLPIAVDDGLLSAGDGHAAQGDGESVTTSRSAGRSRGRPQRGSLSASTRISTRPPPLPSRGCSISCSANTAWIGARPWLSRVSSSTST